MGTETDIIPMSRYLGLKTAVEAKVSDHNLVIRGRTLFLNMMMQGRWNDAKHRYNNGFALVESDSDYQVRIKDVVRMLAEAVAMNPHIMFIGLAEAPIKLADIDCMINEARKYRSLSGFLPGFKVSNFSSMGVATFINHDHFNVVATSFDKGEKHRSLQGRVQRLALTAKDGAESLELVNLHLPYDIAKSENTSELIAFSRDLFSKHQSTPVVVMGDFNINPRRIAEVLVGVAFYIQINNNVLVRADVHGAVTHQEFDTVDAVFESTKLLTRGRRDYVDARLHPSVGVDLRLAYRLTKEVLTRASTEKTVANTAGMALTFFDRSLPGVSLTAHAESVVKI